MSAHLIEAWGALVKAGRGFSEYETQVAEEWTAKVMAGLGTIYRGYNVNMPESFRESLWDLFAPPMEEYEVGRYQQAGPRIINWLQESHPGGAYSEGLGLGRHWTANKSFADKATFHGNISGNFPIMLSAEYEPSMVDMDFTMTQPSMARSEEEVTLKAGANVLVTGVYSEVAKSWGNLLKSPVRARV